MWWWEDTELLADLTGFEAGVLRKSAKFVAEFLHRTDYRQFDSAERFSSALMVQTITGAHAIGVSG